MLVGAFHCCAAAGSAKQLESSMHSHVRVQALDGIGAPPSIAASETTLSIRCSGLQPLLDQPQYAGIGDAMLYALDQPAFVEIVEKAAYVSVQM